MEEVRVQIIIPARNSADLLDKTIESIFCQELGMDNIYIIVMDFGSSDGTYEKALNYNRYHMGVYRAEASINSRQMVSEIVRISQYTRPEGSLVYQMVLYPGDILYPQCLKKCSDALVNNISLAPNMLICETDILRANKTIGKQAGLFPMDTIIDGKNGINHYIERGYNHQVICIEKQLRVNRYRSSGEMNEQRWWNKCVRSNLDKNAIYLSEVLGCVKEVNYDDELEEILLRWEAIISIARFYKSNNEQELNSGFNRLSRANLAEYALWRSWILYQSQAKRKEAEDCFLISSVIFSQIERSNIYILLQKLVFENDISIKENIGRYFESS